MFKSSAQKYHPSGPDILSGLQSTEVDSAGDITRMPRYGVRSWTFRFIHKYGYFPTKDIVKRELHNADR
jgi:hypothetical protein